MKKALLFHSSGSVLFARTWPLPSFRLSPNEEGQDFLFLFDLLAHTCGIESTLRVLTHSDDNFYDLCKPNIDLTNHLVLEEDKLKVSWKPADIELWMHDGKRYRSQRAIDIDSYEVRGRTLDCTYVFGMDGFPKEKSALSAQRWFCNCAHGSIIYAVSV